MSLLDYFRGEDRVMCFRFPVIFYFDLEPLATTYYLTMHCLKCVSIFTSHGTRLLLFIDGFKFTAFYEVNYAGAMWN